MLELDRSYSIKEIGDLKDFVIVAYVIIDDIYQKVTPTYIRNRCNINDSILSDSEIITISIVGELLTIDSENAWFSFCKKNMKDLFPRLCDRSRFNRTRRNLHAVIEEIRKELSSLTEFADQPYRIIDSMPIPVCKFGRARFHKTFRGHGATYGKCPSKKETYLGYKLHMLTTLDGLVTDFVITSANIDDRVAVWDLAASYKNITMLGDKGYTKADLSKDLKSEKGIDLLPVQKNNNKDQFPKAIRQLIFKLRKRIETTGSQLTQQLNIEQVLAKSFWGLQARIKTKLLAYNLCYYINKLIGQDINISKIKHLVFG
ncbi:transposase, IS4 family [Desulforamulus putei DSM 12395]|uniref:Transposase, IS4 family n=1 Tax=Desulforamulus putei DSM 12395 TaxID=1121429 RepID=A0A1M5D1J2_9FIRM|nr:IS982 family transposase [Desulforamulus putei]SHF60662.1 transposase, IS4 family [Desulforamulus putei DSM 12395]